MSWSIDAARDFYNLTHWGQGYFDIGPTGEVLVRPNKSHPEHGVALNQLAKELYAQGARFPLLLRFPQILQHRLNSLCRVFNQAIAEFNYEGHYLAVYPIKVNQHQDVLNALLQSHAAAVDRQFGLEAGSKPELMAVLAYAQHASSKVICNGYKDRDYIRLALIGQKMGHDVCIVLEKLTEVDFVLQEAKRLDVRPRLGVRIRLASQGKGKWQASGGERSKFGLSAAQILTVIEILKRENLLDCLTLLHFHLGSQIANIRDLRSGVTEAGQIYLELRRLGVALDTIDVGGGLAVDYEGTRSQSSASMNYSMQEYANNIIYTLGDLCREAGAPMPNLISESGRNLTAHHGLVISDVIGRESHQPCQHTPPREDAPAILQSMWRSWLDLQEVSSARSVIELYNDTQFDLTQVHNLFQLGSIGFQDRAWAEQLSLEISSRLQQILPAGKRVYSALLDEINERLADKYFVNFSLFQALPDAWGIHQLFPVLPLQGLHNSPSRRALILDITCDSDGMIEQYLADDWIENTLPVPAPVAGEPLNIGFFLTGAYQESLSNDHNLFSRMDSAVIEIKDDGQCDITRVRLGETIQDALHSMAYDKPALLEVYRALLTHAEAPDLQELLSDLESALESSTYLSPNGGTEKPQIP